MLLGNLGGTNKDVLIRVNHHKRECELVNALLCLEASKDKQKKFLKLFKEGEDARTYQAIEQYDIKRFVHKKQQKGQEAIQKDKNTDYIEHYNDSDKRLVELQDQYLKDIATLRKEIKEMPLISKEVSFIKQLIIKGKYPGG